jgi:S1-C subfamily serine protease
VAILLAASMIAAAGGVVVGRNLVDEPNVSSSVTPAAPVTTVAGPVPSGATEPVAAVAAAVAPAVVQIETTQGLGSGFIYDASGLILTAGHVVDGAQQVQVRLADGTRLTGTVVGTDDSTDVAVVRIPQREGLPVAKLATGVPLQVGQMAIAIGSPFGLDQTVTAGIVSAVGRSTETPGGVIPAVQTDAPINSGNSGGALVDRQGRIIGINDSIITGNSANSGNVGVGFAIPIDIAKVVADKLVAGQSTEAGYLGVAGADATGDRAGAALTQVESGSPAAKAGLTTDDVVVEADGRKVASMIDLAAEIRTNEPGSTIRLKVLRNGKERTVEVTLTTAPG